MDQAATKKSAISYGEMLTFFVPLAITAMLMMGSHNIISSALSRTAGAAAALAAYSVAASIAQMFESPCFALRRVYVALLDDKASFRTLMKVSGLTILLVVLVQMTIGFTPVGRFIFVNLVGIPEDLFPETITAFRIFIFFPILSALRSIYQGLIIVRRKTHILTINMLVRLATMLAVTTLITRTEAISGAVVGSIVLVSGMGVEGLLAYLTGRRMVKDLPDKAKGSHEALTAKTTWIFFIPLIGALFLQSFARPALNAGLARAADAEIALAAFQVAWSFAWIFAGISMNIHQLVIVFSRDHESYRMVRRFVIGIGVVSTAALLLITVTPAGVWALTTLIGADPAIAGPALQNVALLAFVPLILTVGELYSGLLMKHRETAYITLSKIVHLVVVVASMFVLIYLFPNMGGMVAGLATLIAHVAEAGTIILAGKRLAPRRTAVAERALAEGQMARAGS